MPAMRWTIRLVRKAAAYALMLTAGALAQAGVLVLPVEDDEP